ncbi:hypothetical protein C4B63_45g183 [Trypanosoma cruzi]|uniref:Uncharacterized protein n=1 Tax=Trypanosoma cruzi TaxID=5693 RepID=A0A2V2V455_TRYCR|nr:hypothetical protein C4B63_45g183 [Trypanosoma cruzi]
MAAGQYTEQGIAHIWWHTSLLTRFGTQLTNTRRSTIRRGTHRYSLCGARPSDPGGKDLITQEALERHERVQLARAGCGETELWGRLHWAVRGRTNQRRFCSISPEQSAYMRSNDDPTAPGTDAVPPTTRGPTHLVRREDPPHGVGSRNARTVTPDRWDTRTSSVTVGVFIRNTAHRFPSSNAISVTRSSPHGKAPHSTERVAHTTLTPTDI